MILRYFWVGLDLFCPSACFRRSRGYDEVAPSCRQTCAPLTEIFLLTRIKIFFLIFSTTCQSLAFSTIIPRAWATWGLGWRAGDAECCGACTEEGEAGCPRTDCLPVTQSRSLEDHPSSSSRVCELFPGVTSLCEQRNISRFL